MVYVFYDIQTILKIRIDLIANFDQTIVQDVVILPV